MAAAAILQGRGAHSAPAREQQQQQGGPQGVLVAPAELPAGCYYCLTEAVVLQVGVG